MQTTTERCVLIDCNKTASERQKTAVKRQKRCQLLLTVKIKAEASFIIEMVTNIKTHLVTQSAVQQFQCGLD